MVHKSWSTSHEGPGGEGGEEEGDKRSEKVRAWRGERRSEGEKEKGRGMGLKRREKVGERKKKLKSE